MERIDGTPPAPRPPARWPIYVLVALLVIAASAALAVAALRRGGLLAGAAPTATPARATAPAGSSATAGGSGGQPTATAAVTSSAQRPTNPTTMHVTNGSCTVHRITWSWSGARGATAYDVVLYDPITHAEVRTARTTAPSYTLDAGFGATVALKVRSRNGAGTPGTFFTPGDRGQVPPQTTNPTGMTVSTVGHTLTWFWTGARHATAYDVVLYHYVGATARDDVSARVATAHWGLRVTPGVTYYLKVRAVGACAPSAFYTPARPARAGT